MERLIWDECGIEAWHILIGSSTTTYISYCMCYCSTVIGNDRMDPCFVIVWALVNDIFIIYTLWDLELCFEVDTWWCYFSMATKDDEWCPSSGPCLRKLSSGYELTWGSKEESINIILCLRLLLIAWTIIVS